MTRQEVQTLQHKIKEMHTMFLNWFDSEYSDIDESIVKQIGIDISNMFYEKEASLTAALIEQKDEIYLLDI